MNVNDLIPSKYLNGNDLKGRTVTARIKRIAGVNMPNSEGGGRVKKYVMYFDGKERGVILNRTTAMQIAEALGEMDTDNWPGLSVELFPVTIEAFGSKHCVVNFRRATKVQPAPTVTEPATAPAAVDQDTGEVLDHGEA